MSDENDYSQHTLDELREIARRVQNVDDADLQWRLKVQIARREGEEDLLRGRKMPHFSYQRYELRYFNRWIFDNNSAPRDYRWLFDHGEIPRTSDAIYLWWDDRRQFFHRLFPLIAGCGVVSYLLLLCVSSILRGNFDFSGALTSALGALPALVWACAVLLIVVIFVTNVIYFLFATFDVVTNAVCRFCDWRWSIFLFCLLLCSGLVVAALPCLSLIYALATA
jgi:hypothetical protein